MGIRAKRLIERLEQRERWVLAAIVFAFLAYHCAWRSNSYFGHFGDDAAYFASAKSLAEGKGYVIPNMPGSPNQTKYPILYPLMLSAVWRVNPNFPENIGWVYSLNALFGAMFIVASHVLLRGMGYGVLAASLIVVFSAFHPTVQILSSAALSDIPAAALSITAMAVAERWLAELNPRKRWILFVCAAVAASLAILVRTVGIAIAAGITLYALLRKAPRAGLAFGAVTAAVAAASLSWPRIWGVHPQVAASVSPEHHQNLLYNTSYLGFWIESVPDANTLLSMLGINAIVTFRDVGALVFGTGLSAGPMVPGIAAIVLAGICIWGLYRKPHGGDYGTAHYVLPFYVAIVLCWNYPISWRFLVLFTPVFALGAYVAGKTIVQALMKGYQSGRTVEKLLAAVYLAVVASIGAFSIHDHIWKRPREMFQAQRDRARRMTERLKAYEWISENSAAADRVISYEGGVLYLYTQRQGMGPLALTTETVYTADFPVVDRIRQLLPATAKEINAKYWLVASDDWSGSSPATARVLQEAVKELLGPCPVAARFSAGSHEIRRILPSDCDLNFRE